MDPMLKLLREFINQTGFAVHTAHLNGHGRFAKQKNVLQELKVKIFLSFEINGLLTPICQAPITVRLLSRAHMLSPNSLASA